MKKKESQEREDSTHVTGFYVEQKDPIVASGMKVLESEWEERFDKEFGQTLINQKTKLYNDGEYSRGFQKDYEHSEDEVNKLKSFIRQLLKEEKSKSYAEGEANGLRYNGKQI